MSREQCLAISKFSRPRCNRNRPIGAGREVEIWNNLKEMKSISSFFLLVALTGLLALVSCSEEKRMAKGFVLPKGEIEAGKRAFSELKCTLCHSVAGVEFPEIEAGAGFELGGEVRRIKTYGELVTAVIDPTHDVNPKFIATRPPYNGEKPSTPMPAYNSNMTVKQLSDIVIFLHSRFQEEGPDFTDYPYLY
jgi:sulfur-oxidizing protein SoxX